MADILLFYADSEDTATTAILSSVGEQFNSHNRTYAKIEDFILPPYNKEQVIQEGFGEKVHAFYELLAEHDAYVLAFETKNGDFPSRLNNLLAWSGAYSDGREKIFHQRPLMLLAAATALQDAQQDLARLVIKLSAHDAKVCVARHVNLPFDKTQHDDLNEAIAKFNILLSD